MKIQEIHYSNFWDVGGVFSQNVKYPTIFGGMCSQILGCWGDVFPNFGMWGGVPQNAKYPTIYFQELSIPECCQNPYGADPPPPKISVGLPLGRQVVGKQQSKPRRLQSQMAAPVHETPG